MNRTEALKLLKGGRDGVRAWNDSRSLYHEPPDLTGANLDEADLRMSNLKGVLLSGASLRYANLSGADLSPGFKDSGGRNSATKYTRLQTSLSGANLNHAILGEANLFEANLSDADLSYTTFHLTNLTSAILTNADFTKAALSETVLADLDLTSVKGLEFCDHLGPSVLDYRTLARSSKLPEAFLRGCGLPDSYIAYLDSLAANPIEFYSCFISYSHEDKSFAKRLFDTLQGRGIRCWLDEKQILPGDKVLEAVDVGIRLWDKVLLCCSRTALESWWVNDEIEKAIQKERELKEKRNREVLAIIPLNLDGFLFSEDYQSGYKSLLKSRYSPDFTSWDSDNAKYEDEFERLVRALRSDEGAREKPPLNKL